MGLSIWYSRDWRLESKRIFKSKSYRMFGMRSERNIFKKVYFISVYSLFSAKSLEVKIAICMELFL